MIAAKLVDDEIANHLKQLSTPQKQVVLVVLKTMTAQNNGTGNDFERGEPLERNKQKKEKLTIAGT